ncbi:adenylate kinase 9 [Protopterus annectens]|uniref:adenylate kinase 9 n=1 Tax=Protopterus annectens TaxID=7888 RepID=UPI001CFAA7EE|nr:adenylate kinase 9 [Protopterus annectens]
MAVQQNPEENKVLQLADKYDEDEAEKDFLLSKPICFLIVGKPGVGKTTLGKKLSQAWKCILIEATELLRLHISESTEFGTTLQEMLIKGQSITEEIITKMILDKINSAEAAHLGYVLCGLPSLSEEYLKIPEQIELLKNLKLHFDFIINIKCPDYDLCQRLSGQRQHFETGRIYQRDEWDPELLQKKRNKMRGEEEEEEEEEEGEEEQDIEGEEVMKGILPRLLRRPEDFPENTENKVVLYKDTVLRQLEDLMADHNPQYLIELNGNKSPDDLFISVVSRLESMGLRRGAIPIKLHSAEEEASPDMETEELFRRFSSAKQIAPRYRWRRSKWGRACPVALKNGNFMMGKPEFCVSFLDKMYVLSSQEAQQKFLMNPRQFLLPPMPRPTCKIVVLGPISSGKSTLCSLIAHKYGGKVVDVSKLLQPLLDEAKQRIIEKVQSETTVSAINAVKYKLQQEMLQREQDEAEAQVTKQTDIEHDKISSAKYEEEEGESQSDLTPSHENTDEKEDVEKQKDENKDQENTFSEIGSTEVTRVKSVMPEVTEYHPEVQAMIAEAVKSVLQVPITLPPDVCIEELKKTLEIHRQHYEENSDGPTEGGWILDNFPKNLEQWTVLVERGIVPDMLISLKDTANEGNFLLGRLYKLNKEEINGQILQRLQKERSRKKQEAEEAARQAGPEVITSPEVKQDETQKSQQNLESAEEQHEGTKLQKSHSKLESTKEHHEGTETTEAQTPSETQPQVLAAQALPDNQPQAEQLLAAEPGTETMEVQTPSETQPQVLAAQALPDNQPQSEQLLAAEPDIILPQVTEGQFPEGPEIDLLRQKINTFKQEEQLTESAVKEYYPFIQITSLEIADKTPEDLLHLTVQAMERPFKYHGWEMSGTDLDEELEDVQAEAEAEEQEEEEEEEEGKEEEVKSKKRQMGDTKHFCPVALKENYVLFPGNLEYAAKYREKVYYCSSSNARDKFLENPENYIAHNESLKAPPLRAFILGAHGAGKTTHGRWLADKLGIFHIQFKECLQEIIIPKTKKKIGPEYEEETETEELPDIESLLSEEEGKSEQLRNTDTKGENEAVTSQAETTQEEVTFTEEEEMVKSYLTDGESLAPEVLDTLIPKWWTAEPFRSQGFILEGFPQREEEVEYLAERGLFPDIALLLVVEENDISDRLLPPRLAKWREKHNRKLELKKRIKELKTKKREEQISKRRAELLAEQAEKMAQKAGDEGTQLEQDEDEDIEAEEFNIEDILAEEFPEEEEEEEEEEEQEEDAVSRLRSVIGEKFETELISMQVVQEQLGNLLVPCIEINSGRKPHIVRFQLYKKLQNFTENRESIFEKCYTINYGLARRMLQLSYKHPSIFGFWDPVQLTEGEVIQPLYGPHNPSYPVIHRQYIYFFANKENREKFMAHPIKYIQQPKPKPAVPIKIAIIGPPKSGKSSVAKNFASEYGLQRISIGEAIRSILTTQEQSELAIQINKLLTKGQAVPDELAIQCLEVMMLDLICNTRGFVLDGYPVTRRQVELLEARSIIPVKIIELQIDTKESLKRGLLDRKHNPRPYPVHDSSQILTIRSLCYKQEIEIIRDYYQKQHQNWCILDGYCSKWWIWDRVVKEARDTVRKIQNYLEKIGQGKAACIADLCITPQELQSRLGEFGEYCPVSLALYEELVDCSLTSSLEFAAEFRGHYYKMASQENLKKFLATPDIFVLPLALHPLPPPHMLPKKLSATDVKARFPKQAEMMGYCSVTYLDGKQRYEALVPGMTEHAAEYRDKIFIFESEEKLDKFMRKPAKYWNQKLPHKVPPKKEPVLLTSLPMLGYLEQGVATAVIKALTAVGCLKPKYPFLSIKRSALLYMAFYLKAYNPKNSEYVRKKYKKKLEQYEEYCELITYLGSKMTRKYKEPQERPIDFDHKLKTFLALKDIEPTSTWVT